MSEKNWMEVRLNDILDVKHGYSFKSDYFVDDGEYILLTPGNFYESGGFKLKQGDEKWYDGPIPDGYILSRGDLLIAMTEQAEGLLGSSILVPESDRYLHNQRLGLITNLDDNILKEYVYHLFNTPEVRSQIAATANGTKVRHTSPSRIGEVETKIPPLDTQKKIVSILSSYDDLIKNNEDRIDHLNKISEKVYIKWFADLKYPGSGKNDLVESAKGEIPEGWEVKKIKQVADVNAEFVNKDSKPDRIHYITIGNVEKGKILDTEELDYGEAPGRAKRVVHDGDIIWSSVRPNLEAYALILDPKPNTIVTTGFSVLTATEIPWTYLYSAVTTPEFVGYLDNHASGSAYPSVNVADFKNAEIIIPDADLLNRFDSLVRPMYRLRRILEKQNIALTQARDLLLPRLLSNELDISDISYKPSVEDA